MDVVSHKNICMDMAVMVITGLLQIMTETSIVFIGNKDRATVITSLNNMLWPSWQDIAGLTWHGATSL